MIVNPTECKLASVVFVCVHCAPHVVYVFRFFIHFLSFSFSLIALGSCERTFKRARRELKGAVENFLEFFDCFLLKKKEDGAKPEQTRSHHEIILLPVADRFVTFVREEQRHKLMFYLFLPFSDPITVQCCSYTRCSVTSHPILADRHPVPTLSDPYVQQMDELEEPLAINVRCVHSTTVRTTRVSGAHFEIFPVSLNSIFVFRIQHHPQGTMLNGALYLNTRQLHDKAFFIRILSPLHH